jgi:hypothetical protein
MVGNQLEEKNTQDALILVGGNRPFSPWNTRDLLSTAFRHSNTADRLLQCNLCARGARGDHAASGIRVRSEGARETRALGSVGHPGNRTNPISGPEH